MRHKRISRAEPIKHRIVSVPAKGVQPMITYKARVQAVIVEGKQVIFKWAIYGNGK